MIKSVKTLELLFLFRNRNKPTQRIVLHFKNQPYKTRGYQAEDVLSQCADSNRGPFYVDRLLITPLEEAVQKEKDDDESKRPALIGPNRTFRPPVLIVISDWIRQTACEQLP